MNIATCPDSVRLRDYLHGELAGADQQSMDSHLEACPACLTRLDELDDEAGFPWLRQTASSTGPATEPALGDLMSRVKRLAPASPSVPGLAVGQVLGSYRLIEMIGVGGMGQVFKAEHLRMKRIVALKVLAPDVLGAPGARGRFQREIEAVSRLASPHIVAAFDAGECDGRDYLAMEFIEGRNLAEIVGEKGPCPVPAALDYLVQAAQALRDAHAAGIVHRDVKPANLLLDSHGIVKLSDLGLARIDAASSGGEQLTHRAVVMGTAGYMAPEQAADTHAADPRADIYSLGCTCFFLLTGRAPYAEGTAMATVFAHREQPIPSLRALRPDCPPAVERFYRRLVAKRPEDRPASMNDVVALLERLQRGPLEAPTRRRWPWYLLAGAAAACVTGLALLFPPSQTGTGGQVASTSTKTPAVEMVLIKPGAFWIGSSESDPRGADDEKPRKKVQLTQRFLLGKSEVTQAQFEEVMGVNPSAFSAAGRFKDRVKGKDTKNHPVESVSWLDAVRFCNRLSERHDLQPYYLIDASNNVTIRGGSGYRLPTEAEWEFACRGGADTAWHFGENVKELGDFAWHAGNSVDLTHPVAEKKPNSLGLFDMHGNVPEWCWDRYDPGYYKRMPVSDPPGSGYGVTRVYRGGAWNSAAEQTRCAARESLGSAYSVLTIVGLRVARNSPE